MSLAFVGALAAGLSATAFVMSCLRPRGAGAHHPDEIALRDAGWTLGVARWEGARLLSALGVAAAAAVFGLPLAIALLALVAPSVVVRVRASARRVQARRALVRVAVGVEAALRSGASLPDAVRRETDACVDPLAHRALSRAVRAFELGEGLDPALRAAALDVGDRRSAQLLETMALGLAERLSTARLIELMSDITDRFTFEQRLEDEVKARASGLRQQQWLLAALVPLIAVLLVISMPQVAAQLSSPIGRMILVPGAIALEVCGLLLSARIVDEVLA